MDAAARTLRIGGGAGFSGDRIDPAVDLAAVGKLDFLVFECLAERTIALAQLEKRSDPTKGYDPYLEERMTAVLPVAMRNRCRIISNMGAANPPEAARKIGDIASAKGLAPKIAWLEGDDVLDLVLAGKCDPLPPPDILARTVSANAYLGALELRHAIATGADVVLTGRVTDSALFLAPAMLHFGWADTDLDIMARGIVLGHMLECGPQATGGYFHDMGRKAVPDPARIGFPLAEVAPDGSFILTKLSGTGGRVDAAVCKEQLLYEVHDPAAYLTPDVTADFSCVTIEEMAADRVRIGGAKGKKAPDHFKVLACYANGYIGEAECGYAGEDAVSRARLAGDIMRERLGISAIRNGFGWDDLRIELIGMNSLHDAASGSSLPYEVRLRVALRSDDPRAAKAVGYEMDALMTAGPAGGGGPRKAVRPIISTFPTFIKRMHVTSRISVKLL